MAIKISANICSGLTFGSLIFNRNLLSKVFFLIVPTPEQKNKTKNCDNDEGQFLASFHDRSPGDDGGTGFYWQNCAPF